MRNNKCRTNSPLVSLTKHIQVAIRSTRPEMAIVFRARPHGRLMEINRNNRGKFLKGIKPPISFEIEIALEHQINLE